MTLAQLRRVSGGIVRGCSDDTLSEIFVSFLKIAAASSCLI